MTKLSSTVVVIISLLMLLSMTSGPCSGDDYLSENVDADHFMVFPFQLAYQESISYLFVAHAGFDIFLLSNLDYQNSYFFDFLGDQAYLVESGAVYGPMSIFMNGSLPFSYIEQGSFLNVTKVDITLELDPGNYYLIVDNTNVATFPQSKDRTENSIFMGTNFPPIDIEDVETRYEYDFIGGTISFFEGLKIGTVILIIFPVAITTIGYLGRKEWRRIYRAVMEFISMEHRAIGAVLSVIGGVIILSQGFTGKWTPFICLVSPSISLLPTALFGVLIFLRSLSMVSYPARRDMGMATIAAAIMSIILGGAQPSHAFGSFWNMNFLAVGAFLVVIGVLVHLDRMGEQDV